MQRRWPKFTLQQLLMVVSLACIVAAQATIKKHYALSPLPEFPEIKAGPTEVRALGAINFFIVCGTIAFRKRGSRAFWGAIAAAFLTTAIIALVCAMRY